MQSVPAASTASTTVSRLCRQRWPTGCSTAPQIVCSLIGSCESKVGRSIRSPMRQSDTLRCDPMQPSSWPIPLRPADTDSRPRIKCCVRSSTDAADTSGVNSWALSSTLGASIRSSFLPITGHVGNARFMHCAAAIEQVRRTFRALPLCAWLHVETDNGPRSLRVSGIPMRGISTRDCATYWG